MLTLKRWSLLFLMMSTYSFMYAQPSDEADLTLTVKSDVDIQRKLAESKQLTLNAIKHFSKVSLENACNDFINSNIWRKGELFVFVIDTAGIVYAHGDDHDVIWKSFKDVQSLGGGSFMKDAKTVGEKGGRVSYIWDNAFKTAFVKTVKKDNGTYIIGSGFFPENNEYQTEQLVKSAVSFFKKNGPESTFATISNQHGPFIKGDIYMFAYDFDGVCVAHGQNGALVGQNLIDLTDSRGNFIIKALVELARTKGSGWYNYEWRHEPKRSYVERVEDPKTKKKYLISAGYYPNVTLQTVKTYVTRAISFLKTNGAKVAFSEFSNLVGEFAKGGLGIYVFDFDGKCLANGDNPALVGQNLSKLQSQGGKFFVQEFIKAARRSGKALVNYTNNNAHAVAYVVAVETPDGKFVIGADYYPASKTSSAQTLVNEAVALMEKVTPEEAFGRFSSPKSSFVRGDLNIFVYEENGTRLVNGVQKAQIWHNFLKATDQEGKPIVNDLVTIALNGGGWATYKARNATRKVFVKAIEKKAANGKVKNYIVGSGYFL